MGNCFEATQFNFSTAKNAKSRKGREEGMGSTRLAFTPLRFVSRQVWLPAAAAKGGIAGYDRSDMPTKVQELIARLGADGWYQVRQKGSHRQYRHPTKQGTVTVAGKPSVEVPPGTLNNILKQAGLKK